MTRVFDEEPDDEQLPKRSPENTPLDVTSWRSVVVAVLSGGVVAWFLIETLNSLGKSVPVTPWLMSALMLVFGSLVLGYARLLKAQIAAHLNPEPGRPVGPPVDSQRAFMALVLGKTMVFTGALMVGGHLVYVALNLGRLEVPMPRARAIWGTLAVFASAFFAWAGWVLERACRNPKPDADTEAAHPSASAS